MPHQVLHMALGGKKAKGEKKVAFERGNSSLRELWAIETIKMWSPPSKNAHLGGNYPWCNVTGTPRETFLKCSRSRGRLQHMTWQPAGTQYQFIDESSKCISNIPCYLWMATTYLRFYLKENKKRFQNSQVSRLHQKLTKLLLYSTLIPYPTYYLRKKEKRSLREPIWFLKHRCWKDVIKEKLVVKKCYLIQKKCLNWGNSSLV